MKRRIHLDHHSGTPVAPEVDDAMRPWLADSYSAATAFHRGGVEAREAIALAREQVAAFVRARSAEEIVFTSGATEAANLAVKGVAFASAERGRHIVVGAVEHPAVLNSADWLASQGFSVSRVRVSRSGQIDPEAVREVIRDDTVLVCLQHANPDVGALQPVRDVGVIAAERGVPLFIDASASAGSIALDFRELGASLATLAPHRFNGPKGVGVLWRRPGVAIAPLIHGGGQESGLRAGTENVGAIVGAGLAAEMTAREIPVRAETLRTIQSALLQGVRERVAHVALTGPEPGDARLPDHLSFVVEFCEGEGLALILDLAGVAIGAGPSCIVPGRDEDDTLCAMGLSRELARGAIRLTLGRESSPDDTAPVLDAIERAVSKLRDVTPAWEDFRAGRRSAVLPARVR